MKVCAVCGTAVRRSRNRKAWFHTGAPPELQTIAREVKDEQYPKAPGVRPQRIEAPPSHMVTEIEGL